MENDSQKRYTFAYGKTFWLAAGDLNDIDMDTDNKNENGREGLLPLEARIEALLFWKGEPMKIDEAAKAVGANREEMNRALENLSLDQESRGGIVLVRKDDEIALGTHPEASAMIEQIAKEDLAKDLGKSALEVLTIILYRGPVGKPEMDYIRGVSCGYALRHLLVRGLAEKIPNPERAGGFLYRASFELLGHLGLSKIEDLPEYDTFRKRMEEAEEEKESLFGKAEATQKIS